MMFCVLPALQISTRYSAFDAVLEILNIVKLMEAILVAACRKNSASAALSSLPAREASA
jgi:hypothetical protein